LLTLLLASVSGCGFWDEVTSRDFKFKELWIKPDALKVLETSKDSDHRAKALRRLKEPKFNGGSDEDQDMVVQLLCTAANTEKHSICRLAAIQTMGKFKDPRVVEGFTNKKGEQVDGLVKAYYNASLYGTPPEAVHMLKCAALKSLGETGQPAAVPTLVLALRQPRPDPDKTAGDIRLRVNNELVTAARALGHFNQYQATEALLTVLQKDTDPSIRNRARESLCEATGKDFPADAQVWAEFLHNPPGQQERSDFNPIQKVVNWISPSSGK
jgi:HEAT repeat protein